MDIDPDRLDRFLSDPKVPQADKDAAASMIRGQVTSAAPKGVTLNDIVGAGQEAADYVLRRGEDIAGAARRLSQVVPEGATLPKHIADAEFGQPTSFGEKLGRFGERALDVATVAGPAYAPGLTAFGVGAGAVGRGAGLSQEEAQGLESAATLAGAGVNAFTKGVSTAAGLRGAISQRYKDILGAVEKRGISLPTGSAEAQGLRELAQEHLGDLGFTKKTAERQTAKALVKWLTPGAEDVPFKDLDEARIALSKIPQASRLRGAIANLQKGLVQGTPEGAAWRAVNSEFGAFRGRPLIQSVGGLLGQRHSGLVGGLSTAGLGLGAAHEAYQGRYKRAAELAGAAVIGGMNPAQIGAMGRGAVGPVARGVLATGVSPGVRNLMEAETAPEAAGPPEPEGVAPESAPAPQRPQQAPGTPQEAFPVVEGKYGRAIGMAAKLAGLPPQVLQAVMAQESGGDPTALSHPAADQAPTPAHGLMQVTPGTFEDVRDQVEGWVGRKADVDNPLDNLLAGAALWKKYLNKTGGNVHDAALLYHGGENPAGHGPRTQQYGLDVQRRFLALTRR